MSWFEPFATTEDVEAVWKPLTVDETTNVEAWINQASTSLRVIARNLSVDIDALVKADPLAAEVAKNAVVNAVKRVLMNPEGYRQKATTTGPFSDSGTLDTAISTGAIYIADSDIVGLFPKRKHLMRSFTINPGMGG